MSLECLSLRMRIDANVVFGYVVSASTPFIIAILYLVIWQLNVFSFDDAKNYHSIYQKIDLNDLQSLSDVYREVGLVYLFLPFKVLGIDFSTCLKLIYYIFSLSLIMLVVSSRKVSSLSVVGSLSVILFVITNRLYIEGAFNYVRSWVALHFLVFGWFFLFFYGRRWVFLPGSVLVCFAMATHFQTSVIGLIFLVLLWCGNKLVSSRIFAIILVAIFCIALAVLVDVLGLTEIISVMNHSAAENANAAQGIRASLAYQTVFPILCILLVLAYSLYRNADNSIYIAVCVQCAIISVGAMWSFPVLLRFFNLALIYMALVFPRVGVFRNSLECAVLWFAGLLNCLALFFSDVWIAV